VPVVPSPETTRNRQPLGRPASTSHTEIERAAFRLFAERGFEETTLDAIAAEAGVGKRTLFRYFASKADIPWGRFDLTLERFRRLLDATPPDLPLWAAVHRGVVSFNDFPPDSNPTHLERMRLLLETPALQAHSVLRHAEWRQVIVDFVTRRLDLAPGHPLPAMVGEVSLALAMSGYRSWLADPEQDMLTVIDDQMSMLRGWLSPAT